MASSISRSHANIGNLTVIFGCGETDSDLRDFLAKHASTLPFNVQLATSSNAVWDALSSHPNGSRLVLVLTEFAGDQHSTTAYLELCERVRKTHTVDRLPVLALGNVEEFQVASKRDRLFSSGFSDYLMKPLVEKELISKVTAYTQLLLTNEARAELEELRQLKGVVRELEGKLTQAEEFYRNQSTANRSKIDHLESENKQLRQQHHQQHQPQHSNSNSNDFSLLSTPAPSSNINKQEQQQQPQQSQLWANLTEHQQQMRSQPQTILNSRTYAIQQQQQQAFSSPISNLTNTGSSIRTTVVPRWHSLQHFFDFIEHPEYAQVFQSFGFDLVSLRTVTDEDLKSMGISLLGHRKKILSALQIA